MVKLNHMLTGLYLVSYPMVFSLKLNQVVDFLPINSGNSIPPAGINSLE